MKKITLLAAALLSGLLSQAQSFSALYAFDSVKVTSGTTDPTPVPTATGVTFGSFSATGTPVNPNATFRFSFTDWATGATPGSDVYAAHTGLINTAEYYEVTVSPAATYSVTITDITFRVQRSGTGIRTYAVRSSADAYTTNLPASINPANTNLSVQAGDIFYWNLDATTTGQDGSTITLSGPSFTNITSPVTFRFYGWNAEGITGTFSIDNVTINGSVMAPATLTADFTASTVCQGDSTVFTNQSSGPNPIVSTVWDFGDGSSPSSLENPSHLYAAAGNYEVTLTVIDNMANTNTFSDSITVYALPVADFSAPWENCGGIAQFYDSSEVADGTITSWLWDFGDPATGTNNAATIPNPTHTFSGAGDFTVTLTVASSNGCTNMISGIVSNSIVEAFMTTVEMADSVTFTGSVTGGTSPYTYALDFGDGSAISTVSDTVHHYADGTYTACLTITDANGCSDSTCTTFTILTTGISKIIATSIRISPNPSADGLFILNAGTLIEGTITVYNIIGKTIVTKQITEGRNMIDLSAEANGSYFVHIKTDKEVITKKIILNK